MMRKWEKTKRFCTPPCIIYAWLAQQKRLHISQQWICKPSDYKQTQNKIKKFGTCSGMAILVALGRERERERGSDSAALLSASLWRQQWPCHARRGQTGQHTDARGYTTRGTTQSHSALPQCITAILIRTVEEAGSAPAGTLLMTTETNVHMAAATAVGARMHTG